MIITQQPYRMPVTNIVIHAGSKRKPIMNANSGILFRDGTFVIHNAIVNTTYRMSTPNMILSYTDPHNRRWGILVKPILPIGKAVIAPGGYDAITFKGLQSPWQLNVSYLLCN